MGQRLIEVHPELESEWSDKNVGLNIMDISYGSNKEIWWKGSCGHIWQASPKSRSNGSGCPYCSGKRVLRGFNDLKSRFPELKAEWSDKNSIRPDSVTTGSHKKVVWKGRCGHEWTAIVKNRVKGAGCPYCASVKALKGFNDLKIISPEIAEEWSDRNKLKPDEVLPNSNQKVWWKCKNGHEWRTTPAIRMTGSRCPYCSNIRVMGGFNDITVTDPLIASEWSEKNAPIQANTIKNTNRQRFWWKCSSCGYEWEKSPYSRVNGSGCPVCDGRIVQEGINDLGTVAPDIAEEWHTYKNGELIPSSVSSMSAKYVWWKGRCNHEWRARIVDRVCGNEPCLICQKEYEDNRDKFITEYYLAENEVSFIDNDMEEIGIPIDIYIPDKRIAIIYKKRNPTTYYEERKEFVKNDLCKKAKIRMIYVLEKGVMPDKNVICISKEDDSIEATEDVLYSLCEIIGLQMQINIKKDGNEIMRRFFEESKLGR